MNSQDRPVESPAKGPLRLPDSIDGEAPRAMSSGDFWVPIRSLGPHHRPRIATHLLALPPGDRYLRFGYIATDEQLFRYVDSIDFEHAEVFGIFNRRLELIAMAHLAHPKLLLAPTEPFGDGVARPAVDGDRQRADLPVPEEAAMSEFGVSVLPKARGRGFGRRLFAHAMLHARNRGIAFLFIHALSENAAMLKIARNAGAAVERHGSESQARLKLPPDTLVSHVGEMVEQGAAEFDYRLKLRARQVSGLFGAFKPTPGRAGTAAQRKALKGGMPNR